MGHLKDDEKELVRKMQVNHGILSLVAGENETAHTLDLLGHLAQERRVEQVCNDGQTLTYRLIRTEAELRELYHDKEVIFEHHGEELAGRVIDICSKTARILFQNALGDPEIALVAFNKIK